MLLTESQKQSYITVLGPKNNGIIDLLLSATCKSDCFIHHMHFLAILKTNIIKNFLFVTIQWQEDIFKLTFINNIPDT